MSKKFLILIALVANLSLAKNPTAHHLGNKWQIKNNLLDLFGPSPELSKKIDELVMSYPEHFGGNCDLYEYQFYKLDDFRTEDVNRVNLGYYANIYQEDVRCRNITELTTPNFIKGVARNALTTKLCYEIFDNETDSYGAIAHLKNIMCDGSCGDRIKIDHVKKLYNHFYSYRMEKNENFGTPEDWGITPSNVDESIKVLGIAFCSDPNWTHF